MKNLETVSVGYIYIFSILKMTMMCETLCIESEVQYRWLKLLAEQELGRGVGGIN